MYKQPYGRGLDPPLPYPKNKEETKNGKSKRSAWHILWR